ncbi:MAG: SH3 domain-containing protein [Bacteroidales bacterium]|nr:SH3 domain-containing protein [Bacteroidales bacterium]
MGNNKALIWLLFISMLFNALKIKAEWLYYDTIENETEVYIQSDIDNGANRGEYILWVVFHHEKPSSDPYSDMMISYVIKDDLKEYGAQDILTMDENGECIENIHKKYPSMHAITPGTLMEDLYTLILITVHSGSRTIDLENRFPIPKTAEQASQYNTGEDIVDTIVTDDKGGYYIGKVIANSLTVRGGPGKNYPSIGILKKGQLVIIPESFNCSEYCSVVSLDGKYVGFVASRYLTVTEKIKENTDKIFEESGKLSYENKYCEIKIKNNVNVQIVVKLNGQPYTIRPGDKKTIKGILAGKISVLATAPGFYPYYGSDETKGGYIYDWMFYEKK